MASRQGIGDTMQKRELELGFVSKREIDHFLRGIHPPLYKVLKLKKKEKVTKRIEGYVYMRESNS